MLNISCVTQGSEKQREKIKHVREAVPVTEVGSQCRLTFKMPGISAKDLDATVLAPSGKVSYQYPPLLPASILPIMI